MSRALRFFVPIEFNPTQLQDSRQRVGDFASIVFEAYFGSTVDCTCL
jgi:hypothetical protein